MSITNRLLDQRNVCRDNKACLRFATVLRIPVKIIWRCLWCCWFFSYFFFLLDVLLDRRKSTGPNSNQKWNSRNQIPSKLEEPSCHIQNKHSKIKCGDGSLKLICHSKCVFYQSITWNERASSQQFTAELNIFAYFFKFLFVAQSKLERPLSEKDNKTTFGLIFFIWHVLMIIKSLN